jgi:hypothetical protein
LGLPNRAGCIFVPSGMPFTFRAFNKKEDPGARRARVYRRMGEGLGAGGHATRRQSIQRVCRRFVPMPCKKVFVEGEEVNIPDCEARKDAALAMRASQSGTFFGMDATAPAAVKPCRGTGAPLRRRQSTGPHACRWEIRDSATPLAGARVRRRGLRRHSACPREIDWAGDRFASLLNSFGPPRCCRLHSTARSMTRERQLFREGARGAVNDVDSCGKRLNPSPKAPKGRVASEASRVGSLPHRGSRSSPHPATGRFAPGGHPPLRGGIQTSKPLSRARSLSEASGRAPKCPITSAAASAPSLAAVR